MIYEILVLAEMNVLTVPNKSTFLSTIFFFPGTCFSFSAPFCSSSFHQLKPTGYCSFVPYFYPLTVLTVRTTPLALSSYKSAANLEFHFISAHINNIKLLTLENRICKVTTSYTNQLLFHHIHCFKEPNTTKMLVMVLLKELVPINPHKKISAVF